jgi:hypothetical protein
MQSTKQKKIDKDGKTNLAFHRYLVLKKAGATDHAMDDLAASRVLLSL